MQKTILMMIILTIPLLSLQWPVENGRVTSSFGESRTTRFHDGIDMISPDLRVYPVSEGSLVYMWNKALFPLDNYPGGGNYKVLRHENDLYSIYMHLQDSAEIRNKYSNDESIARMSNTGHSYGIHLHFTMVEIYSGASINPEVILPEIEDSLPPEIGSILIKIDDRYITLRDNSEIRLTRNYPLLIKIFDTITGSENLGVHRLAVTHNNTKLVDLSFDKLEPSEEGFTVSQKPFDYIFDEAGYYKISDIRYEDGLNEILIEACDFAGNCSQKTYTLDINLDFG